MISIIVPSRNSKRLQSLQENIDQTIGLPYELISYDNTEDGIGICQIYNSCAEKAQYGYLIFCHDDIWFHFSDWGIALIETLKDNFIGLVGVAGATFKSKYPAPWVSVPQEYYRSCLVDNKFDSDDNNLNNFEEVVILDGCFLGTKKAVWQEFKFNEELLKGFHLYDIDFSLRIQKQYKVGVLNSLMMSHQSPGDFDNVWLQESIRFHKVSQQLFPASIEDTSLTKKLDALALRSIIIRSKRLKLPLYFRLKWIAKLLVSHPKMFSYKMLN